MGRSAARTLRRDPLTLDLLEKVGVGEPTRLRALRLRRLLRLPLLVSGDEKEILENLLPGRSHQVATLVHHHPHLELHVGGIGPHEVNTPLEERQSVREGVLPGDILVDGLPRPFDQRLLRRRRNRVATLAEVMELTGQSQKDLCPGASAELDQLVAQLAGAGELLDQRAHPVTVRLDGDEPRQDLERLLEDPEDSAVAGADDFDVRRLLLGTRQLTHFDSSV